MGNYFKIHYNAVKYPIDSEKSRGLRNAQLGAIHAISSFFTLNKKEAAIVIMPTGSGKTAVLMLTPYLIRKQRVLVVTQSKMVCGQIAEDFSELRTLCVANVFNTSIKKPNVFELEHLYTKEYQKDLEQADVIVATPSCALSLSESDWAKENIDLVEVDEAHHTPAKTWQQILVNLSVATHVLFTATPFRLDRKELSGEIVYDYPLSKAYEDGIFGEIQYVPVESGMDNDLCIAKRAEEVLLNDRKAGYEHYLMVRTDTKVSAEKLEKLYKDNTSLNLLKVDSSMSNSKVKHILKLLHSGELDGIVCVDMLGEGYDFPNLKMAAIHVPHKSLASTLQFIGRFARTNAKNIGKAKFIAVNNEELEIENNLLYSKDAVWQDIIIGMSEGKNKSEQQNRNYYKEYVVEDERILENVPVHAIRPNCHVKIYRSMSFDINAEFPEVCNVAGRILRNKQENTVVGIGLEYVSPLWMGSGDKVNLEYILYIIHYQTQTHMVHIYSQKHSEAMYDELVSSFCDSYDPIPKSEIYKALGKLKNFEIFNSGMLSKQSQSGESYRIMAGSDVSDAIDKDSGRMYSAGHAFCKAVDDAEGDITIGYSSASKVWSSAYKDLKDYIQWCDGLGKKIANKDIKVKTNTNFDFLPQPKALVEYPEDIFYADFTAEIYSRDPVIKYRRKESDYECCRLTDAMVVVKNCEKTKVSVEVSVGEISENLECDIKARYRSLENRFIVCSGKEEIPMDKFLTEQPLIYKTVKDMTITGIDVIEGDFESELFDSNIIEGVDWKRYDTNLKLEFRKNDSDTRVSIQDALYKILEVDEKFKYIIYDHGSGEMADYITIYETDNELIVELYHVKKMGSSSYNNSVGDVYEVSGQAIKSVTWFTTKGKLLEKFTSRHNSGHCIVKKGGNFKTMIKEIKTSGKVLRGCICIVQPGIKKSKAIPDRIQEVLAATDSYVKKAGKVNRLRIMGSI